MQDKIRYELTAHAATVMAERKIPAAWVERVLQSPEGSESEVVEKIPDSNGKPEGG
ncbi:MAG: DUF4258 domain-containing protein [Gammaproteobacteria bacterium]|nr:DUF4258 domain-containing protein [Gammaproteobacteria bacterium]